MGRCISTSQAGGVWFQSGRRGDLSDVRLSRKPGRPNLKYLTLHAAELWVETLVAQDTIATIGGRVLVGPTTVLTRDLAPTDTTVYVKHNAWQLRVVSGEFGSKLVMQSGGKFEVMMVLDTRSRVRRPRGTIPTAWRGMPMPSGANQWYAGDAIFDTGKQTGAGGAFIDLFSLRGLAPGSSFGPTIVGNVRIDQSAVGWRERWAIGNLNGVFGNSTNIFGAAFGDPTSTRLQIDATNGVQMLNAAGQRTGHWTMAGDGDVWAVDGWAAGVRRDDGVSQAPDGRRRSHRPADRRQGLSVFRTRGRGPGQRGGRGALAQCDLAWRGHGVLVSGGIERVHVGADRRGDRQPAAMGRLECVFVSAAVSILPASGITLIGLDDGASALRPV